MIGSNLAATFVVALMIPLPAAAQDAGTPSADLLSEIYTGKAYSPYAQRSFPERPLWGDSHLHTNLSMDAGLFGNRLPSSTGALGPVTAGGVTSCVKRNMINSL